MYVPLGDLVLLKDSAYNVSWEYKEHGKLKTVVIDTAHNEKRQKKSVVVLAFIYD
jgi:hypothetical protein